MMTDVNDSEIKIATKPKIGERLRLAREAKKLTINDVATELRLTKHTIDHIENERWSELHGRAYARGYFSNYVKFLGLPEDELLAAFNVEYTLDDPSLLVGDKQDKNKNKKSVWLPVFLIILLFILTWFAYQQWQKMQNTIDVVEDNSSSLSSEIKDNSATFSETIEQQESALLPVPQQEINDPDHYIDNELELPLNSEQNNDALIDDLEVISEQQISPIPTASPDEVLVENNKVAILEGVLDLVFTEDCWVEVKDVNAKVLLNKIMKKDDLITLNGLTPLSVMLGRASAVVVTFNNEIFDALPYTQRDVARFTLGEEL